MTSIRKPYHWTAITRIAVLAGLLFLSVPAVAQAPATPAPAPAPAATPAPAAATPTVEQCRTDTTNNPACADVQRELESNSDKPGKTPGEIQQGLIGQCIWCPLTSRVFAASMLLGERMFTALGPSVGQFLAAIVGLWILWNAGKLLFPFGPMDRMAGIGNAVLMRSLLGIGAAALLLAPGGAGYRLYWDYMYMPVVSGAVELSDMIMRQGMPPGSFLYNMQNELKECGTTGSDCGEPVRGLDREQNLIKLQFETTIYNLQKVFSYGLALGIYLWQEGAFVAGGLLMAVYVFAPFVFIAMLMGVILHWTFLSVLSPALVAAAVFPSTRRYATGAFKQILGSGVTLVVVSIVGVLTAGLVHYSIIAAYESLDAQKGLPEWLRNAIVANPASQTGAQDLTGQGVTQEGINTACSSPEHRRSSGLTDADCTQAGATVNRSRQGFVDGLRQGNNESFGWPASCRDVSSPFGMRRHPIRGTMRLHAGMDIACGIGRPIFASKSGTVTGVLWDGRGYGNYIIIRHLDGTQTLYGHLSRTLVTTGRPVLKGQVIGNEGSTGGSTGPHLHFEIHLRNGNPTNPAPLLAGAPVPDGGAYTGGDSAAADYTSVNEAALMPRLDLRMQALWTILLAGMASGVLMRTAPQMFNQVIGTGGMVNPLEKLPNGIGSMVSGVVAGGLTAAGMGLKALAGQEKEKPAATPRTDAQSTQTSLSGAVYVPVSNANRGNRDPDLAAGGNSAAATMAALPAAGMTGRGDAPASGQTIDVAVVSSEYIKPDPAIDAQMQRMPNGGSEGGSQTQQPSKPLELAFVSSVKGGMSYGPLADRDNAALDAQREDVIAGLQSDPVSNRLAKGLSAVLFGTAAAVEWGSRKVFGESTRFASIDRESTASVPETSAGTDDEGNDPNGNRKAASTDTFEQRKSRVKILKELEGAANNIKPFKRAPKETRTPVTTGGGKPEDSR